MADMRIRGVRLTREERLAVRQLISAGCSFEDAAAAVRCSTKTVQRLLNTVGGMPPRAATRSMRQLSLAEREEVSRGLQDGASYRAIARRLGRAPSTVCREVNGNGGPYRYRACRADVAAYRRARRPKTTKFRRCPRLRAQVESLLNIRWSPQQISARLCVETMTIGDIRAASTLNKRIGPPPTRGLRASIAPHKRIAGLHGAHCVENALRGVRSRVILDAEAHVWRAEG